MTQVGDHEFPSVPEIEEAYQAAHAALAPLVQCDHSQDGTASPDISELLSHLPHVFHQLEQVMAARVGPRVS